MALLQRTLSGTFSFKAVCLQPGVGLEEGKEKFVRERKARLALDYWIR